MSTCKTGLKRNQHKYSMIIYNILKKIINNEINNNIKNNKSRQDWLESSDLLIKNLKIQLELVKLNKLYYD